MPYIIVVNRPGYMPEADPYAVATLDEAREAALNEISRYGSNSWVDPTGRTLQNHAAHVLPESGGTIGPLPDGYVIEVQRVTWTELTIYAGINHDAVRDASPEDIIDAYNK